MWLDQAHGVMQDARTATKDECERIVQRAQEAADGLAGRAKDGTRDPISPDAWPRRMEKYLSEVRALKERAPLVDGPTQAWSALLGVADSAIYEWKKEGVHVFGGEEDCDRFHEDVDALMLEICQAQKHVDPGWIGDERVQEIRELQQKAQGTDGPCTYRCPRTLRFIETGEILDPPVREVVWASRAARKSAPTGVRMAGEDDDGDDSEG